MSLHDNTIDPKSSSPPGQRRALAQLVDIRPARPRAVTGCGTANPPLADQIPRDARTESGIVPSSLSHAHFSCLVTAASPPRDGPPAPCSPPTGLRSWPVLSPAAAAGSRAGRGPRFPGTGGARQGSGLTSVSPPWPSV